MALVDYSDSDSEPNQNTPAQPSAPPLASLPQANFRKTNSGKITVHLPAHSPTTEQDGHQDDNTATSRLAKRARTTGNGAFGGFNSLLPPPKRPSGAVTSRSGGLKTSGEAVFHRRPEQSVPGTDNGSAEVLGNPVDIQMEKEAGESKVELVGSTTRFMPLSVSRNRGKKKTGASNFLGQRDRKTSGGQGTEGVRGTTAERLGGTGGDSKAAQSSTAKKPLFSFHQEAPDPMPAVDLSSPPGVLTAAPPSPPAPAPNPAQQPQELSDLQLSPTSLRRFLGRKHTTLPHMTHIDMSAEYDANERMRQSAGGDAAPDHHRAVRSVAPGKHSLQQLVDNARSQREGLEEKWAEGRRERGAMR